MTRHDWRDLAILVADTILNGALYAVGVAVVVVPLWLWLR